MPLTPGPNGSPIVATALSAELSRAIAADAREMCNQLSRRSSEQRQLRLLLAMLDRIIARLVKLALV
jgi:hypothetical protein